MLDVHPPEHTPHTWRDFFIHMAIIVLGLVIAIGLEQSVEALHRHHEREDLLVSLRGDAAGAIRDSDVAIDAIKLEIAYDQAVLSWIRRSKQSPGQKQMEPAKQKRFHGTPDDFSWRSAQSSGLLTLLTPEENRTFEMEDWMISGLEADAVRLQEERMQLDTMWHAFDDDSGNIDLSQASAKELDHLAGLFSTDETVLQSLQFRLQQIRTVNQEISRGDINEGQVLPALKEVRK